MIRSNTSASKLCAAALALAAFCLLPSAGAEDIDIFVTNEGQAGAANVLIILDNSSNWAQQAQQWPGNEQQGQSEVAAIKSVLTDLYGVNVGLMMSVENGTGNQGGYLAFRMSAMEKDEPKTNKAALFSKLDTIYSEINSIPPKVNSAINYGNMMFDAFKYFGGFTSPEHAVDDVAGTPQGPTAFGTKVFASRNLFTPKDTDYWVDGLAYADGESKEYRTYMPPAVDQGDGCGGRYYIIFIGNGFPNADDPNTLANVDGDTSVIKLPDVSLQTPPGGGVKQYLPVSGGTVSAPTGNAKGRTGAEWARYLRKTDVNAAPGQQNVVTYTINVFNAQPDADQTRLMMGMAQAGGGKYFAATDKQKIIDALKLIFAEIQATNSVFASASLPISATNRSQNDNQVFIGMFRPDVDAKPRWVGNLKRYQIAQFGANYELADVAGTQAVNPVTGFITDCATSWWTRDSGAYWEPVISDPPTISKCPTSTFDPYSDRPDGPFVEKGAVAQMLRERPSTSPRVVKTVSKNLADKSLVNFDPTSAASYGLAPEDVRFILGEDSNDEDFDGVKLEPRPSIHGDVVHSRPLPINYGGGTGTYAFYGANDGTFRAVNVATGNEAWAFVAPEFYAALPRLRTQSPVINYPGMPDGINPPPVPKNYFFDGSIGLYQPNLTKAWIFATMRRGGRMVYAFDVSTPTNPSIKWRVGCPNLGDDNGCSAGMSGIGQTWSLPTVALVDVGGNGTTKPAVIFGGGYDSCEDKNEQYPSCTNGKGNRIYVLDADDGTVLRTFDTEGRVPSDVSLIDIDFDNVADFAYVGDTRGNLYRITFGFSKTTPLAKDAWTLTKVAKTENGRKFHYPPALVPSFNKANGKYYVYATLGSGDREKPLFSQYPYTSSVLNRFYVFVDDVTKTETVSLDDTDTLTDYTIPTSCTSTNIIPGGSKAGWFMDLDQYGKGEQTVTSAVVIGGLVAFSTNRPVPKSPGVCAPRGEARGYWVNLFNASGAIGEQDQTCGGDRSDVFEGGGLPPSPTLGQVPVTTSDGGTRIVTIVLGAADKTGGASSPLKGGEGPKLKPQKRTRLYWLQEGDN